jgi:hypothetical protein
MYPILARYPNHEAFSCIRLTEMGIVCRSSPLCTARVDPEVATCRGPSDARKDSLPWVCREYFRGKSILSAGFTVNLCGPI